MGQSYSLPEHLLDTVTVALRMLFHPDIEEITVQEKGWKIVGVKRENLYSLTISERQSPVYKAKPWVESS